MVPLRLPYAVKDLFAGWLARHYPDRQANVLEQIRAIRGGQLNDATFGQRMTGHGPLAEQLTQLFSVACRRARLTESGPTISTAAFRRPPGSQLEFWSS